MKKYLYILVMIVATFIMFPLAEAATNSCCAKKTCICVNGGCCKDGKCTCAGRCCVNGVCQCAEGKCGSGCKCQK